MNTEMMLPESDLFDEIIKANKEKEQLQKILVALCEFDRRCTVCYRYTSMTDKANCGGCEEYYCECECTPMTPDQIINGEQT